VYQRSHEPRPTTITSVNKNPVNRPLSNSCVAGHSQNWFTREAVSWKQRTPEGGNCVTHDLTAALSSVTWNNINTWSSARPPAAVAAYLVTVHALLSNCAQQAASNCFISLSFRIIATWWSVSWDIQQQQSSSSRVTDDSGPTFSIPSHANIANSGAVTAWRDFSKALCCCYEMRVLNARGRTRRHTLGLSVRAPFKVGSCPVQFKVTPEAGPRQPEGEEFMVVGITTCMTKWGTAMDTYIIA